MRTTTRTTAAVLGLTALLGAGLVAGQAFAVTSSATTAGPAAATATDVATALTYSREEERMARDLYAALAARYDGARPFSAITRSEDRHFDAIGTLLEQYDVTDPSAGEPAGSYAVPAVQDLYDGWLAEGMASLDAAYQVGVELEERDIADLEKAIAGDLPADVDTVLGRLLEGSGNHLAAYERAVDGDLGTGMMNGRGGNGAGNGNGMGARMGNGDCPYADTDD